MNDVDDQPEYKRRKLKLRREKSDVFENMQNALSDKIVTGSETYGAVLHQNEETIPTEETEKRLQFWSQKLNKIYEPKI